MKCMVQALNLRLKSQLARIKWNTVPLAKVAGGLADRVRRHIANIKSVTNCKYESQRPSRCAIPRHAGWLTQYYKRTHAHTHISVGCIPRRFQMISDESGFDAPSAWWCFISGRAQRNGKALREVLLYSHWRRRSFNFSVVQVTCSPWSGTREQCGLVPSGWCFGRMWDMEKSGKVNRCHKS